MIPRPQMGALPVQGMRASPLSTAAFSSRMPAALAPRHLAAGGAASTGHQTDPNQPITQSPQALNAIQQMLSSPSQFSLPMNPSQTAQSPAFNMQSIYRAAGGPTTGGLDMPQTPTQPLQPASQPAFHANPTQGMPQGWQAPPNFGYQSTPGQYSPNLGALGTQVSNQRPTPTDAMGPLNQYLGQVQNSVQNTPLPFFNLGANQPVTQAAPIQTPAQDIPITGAMMPGSFGSLPGSMAVGPQIQPGDYWSNTPMSAASIGG